MGMIHTNSILRNRDQQTSFRACIALGLGLPLLTLKGKVIKDRSWLTDRMMTCLFVGGPSQLCQPLYCETSSCLTTKCNILFYFRMTQDVFSLHICKSRCVSLYHIEVHHTDSYYAYIYAWDSNDASVPTRPNTRLGTGLENCYSATHRLQGVDHSWVWGDLYNLIILIDIYLFESFSKMDERWTNPLPSMTLNRLELDLYKLPLFSSDLRLQVVLLMEVCPGGPSSESILEPHTEDGLGECHLKSHNSPNLLRIHIWILHSSRSLQLLMMAGNCIAERKVRVGVFFKHFFTKYYMFCFSANPPTITRPGTARIGEDSLAVFTSSCATAPKMRLAAVFLGQVLQICWDMLNHDYHIAGHMFNFFSSVFTNQALFISFLSCSVRSSGT